jgi:hypothetical protein
VTFVITGQEAAACWQGGPAGDKVGQSSFLVGHQLGPEELALVDTDAAMRPVAVPA